MNIPYIAMEINAQRERYRVLRVNVINIVRLYNKVSHQLPLHGLSSSPAEQQWGVLQPGCSSNDKSSTPDQG